MVLLSTKWIIELLESKNGQGMILISIQVFIFKKIQFLYYESFACMAICKFRGQRRVSASGELYLQKVVGCHAGSRNENKFCGITRRMCLGSLPSQREDLRLQDRDHPEHLHSGLFSASWLRSLGIVISETALYLIFTVEFLWLDHRFLIRLNANSAN